MIWVDDIGCRPTKGSKKQQQGYNRTSSTIYRAYLLVRIKALQDGRHVRDEMDLQCFAAVIGVLVWDVVVYDAQHGVAIGRLLCRYYLRLKRQVP